MFLGTFIHNIDNKNRLSIPAAIRNQLGKSVVISKGFDGSLNLRTPEEFQVYASKLLSLSQTKLNTRTIQRQLLANAAEIDIDSANRILIPANLIQEAKLQTSVTIIGLGNKLEIWDSLKYAEMKEATDSTLEEVAEGIEDVNF